MGLKIHVGGVEVGGRERLCGMHERVCKDLFGAAEDVGDCGMRLVHGGFARFGSLPRLGEERVIVNVQHATSFLSKATLFLALSLAPGSRSCGDLGVGDEDLGDSVRGWWREKCGFVGGRVG
jgi:hypothetical protein